MHYAVWIAVPAAPSESRERCLAVIFVSKSFASKRACILQIYWIKPAKKLNALRKVACFQPSLFGAQE